LIILVERQLIVKI